MSDPLSHYIVPIPYTEAEDVLEAHQVTYAFYEEVRYRQGFDVYCSWYEQVAEQHRQELSAMRRELNILRWFNQFR
jgi:hypothetical protein